MQVLKTTFRSLFLMLGVFAVVGCTMYDPKYLDLKQQANRNPSPTAIVGMWHRPGPGAMSYLFTSEGKFYDRSANSKFWGGDKLSDPRTYTYNGNGVWADPNWNVNFEVAGEYLLVSFPPNIGFVYERISPEGSAAAGGAANAR